MFVRAESHSLQHHVSRHMGETYQIIGDFESVSNSTYTILHITNTKPDKVICISYVRTQAIVSGGSTIPDVGTFFQLGFGTEFSSGGTLVTPVAMNTTSGKASGTTAYDNNPSVTGTFTEIDRWYVEPNGRQTVFNKDGSIIIGQNDTVEVRFTSDHTAGTAYARITYFLIDLSS